MPIQNAEPAEIAKTKYARAMCICQHRRITPMLYEAAPLSL
jgi:hypothetical protein